MAATDVLTLVEAKEIVDLTGTDEFDAELQTRVTAVSTRLDQLIGPVVSRSIAGEVHDGGYGSVFLEHYPVLSVTSVTEYDGATARTLSEESPGTQPTDGYLSARYKPDPTLRSQRIYRRRNGSDERFPAGRLNVEVSYDAGRFATTADVGQRYKIGAALMLKNLWRSQQSSVGELGQFDVPQSNFPTFAVPRAVREMFTGEIQEPRRVVA